MEKKVKDKKVETKTVKKDTRAENKKKRNIYYAKTSEQKEMGNFIIVIIVVLACVAGIYFLTRAFVTKDLFKKDTPRVMDVTPGEINYSVAIFGTMLNRPEEEYYVVIYDSTSSYATDMSTLVSGYLSTSEHLPVYVIDLSNTTMNGDGKYYDPNNISEDPKSLDDLVVGNRTVIKVKNGQISKFIPDMIQKKDDDGVTTYTSNYTAIEEELTPKTTAKK